MNTLNIGYYSRVNTTFNKKQDHGIYGTMNMAKMHTSAPIRAKMRRQMRKMRDSSSDAGYGFSLNREYFYCRFSELKIQNFSN